MDQPTYRTEPVSFARRGGRLTERQQSAWDELAPRVLVDVPRLGTNTSVDPHFTFDPDDSFENEGRLVVEIGSGRGEALIAAAQAEPQARFLALEVYLPGVAQTLVTLRHEQIKNVRLAVVNAAEALTTMLAPQSVSEVRIWFPDPWHKSRHHKRRLITPEFAAIVARVLAPGGTWRVATDWADYADQIESVMAGSPDFAGGPGERFDGRPLTRFETKGLNVDRVIHDFEATLVPPRMGP